MKSPLPYAASAPLQMRAVTQRELKERHPMTTETDLTAYLLATEKEEG